MRSPKNLQRIWPITQTMLIIMVIYLGWNALFNYVDVTRWCVIGIRTDILNGDRKSIQRALKLLKSSDPAGYAAVCASIDTIEEKSCFNYDPRGGNAAPSQIVTPQNSYQTGGCYIRGTHTLYIAPDPRQIAGDTHEDLAPRRAGIIVRYAQKSKLFWQHANDKPLLDRIWGS